MPSRRRAKHRFMCEAQETAKQVARLWGDWLGVSLTCAHYGETPWVSVQDLAEHHPSSVDTLRRRLDSLENIGRVTSMRNGKVKLYRADPELAEKTYSLLNTMCVNANCSD